MCVKSLEELLGGWDLKLFDKVLHEPFAVGFGVEVVVIDAFYINTGCLARDAWNVGESDFVRASIVIGGGEHSDRNLFDRLKAH